MFGGAAGFGLGIAIQLKDQFTQNAGKINRAFREMEGISDQAAKKVEAGLNRMFFAAKAMAVGVAVLLGPLVAAGATVEMGRALAELSSLGVKNLESVKKAAVDFSNEWAGTSAPEFVFAVYDVKSALADLTDEDLGKFQTAIGITAKATKAELADMTRLFTTASEVFRAERDRLGNARFAEELSGGIAATVKGFRTEGSFLNQAFANLGAIGSQRGWDIAEQLALIGSLQGTMEAAVAGTGLKSFIAQLPKASEELGVAFIDANGNALSALETLKEINRVLEPLGQGEQQEKLIAAFGTEAGPAVAALLGRLDALGPAMAEIDREMGRGSAGAREMAEAMNHHLGASLERAWQRIRNLVETFGEAVVPMVQPLIEGFGEIVVGLQKLLETFPLASGAAAAFAVTFGLLAIAIGAVVGVIGLWGVAGPMLGAVFATIAGKATFLAGILGGSVVLVLAKLLLFIAAIAAVAFVLKAAWDTNFLGIRDTTYRVGEAIAYVWETVVILKDAVMAVFSTMNGSAGQLSEELYQKLGERGLIGVFRLLVMYLYRVKEYWSGFFEGLSAAMAPTMDAINETVEAVKPAAKELAALLSELLGAFGFGSANTVREWGRIVGTVVGWVAGVVIRGLATQIRAAAWLIQNVLIPVVQFLRPVFASVFGFIRDQIQTFILGFSKVMEIVARAAEVANNSVVGGLISDHAVAALNAFAEASDVLAPAAAGPAAGGMADTLARTRTAPANATNRATRAAVLDAAAAGRQAAANGPTIIEDETTIVLDGEVLYRAMQRKERESASRRF